jgi:hypothetical protein
MAALIRRKDAPAAVKPVRSDDPAVEDIQRQVAELQRVFVSIPVGNVVTMNWAGSGTSRVKHGLGRIPSGWVVESIECASGGTCLTKTSSTWTDTMFELYANAACSARVRVF